MAKKKKSKSKNHHSAVKTAGSGAFSLHSFAHRLFNERAAQFQKSGSAVDTVYEGLDLDSIRVKRRLSSVLAVAEEVKNHCGAACPNIPDLFSLEEDWVIMNSYPVSAFDHIEKYVFSSLGAAIWILDQIRDSGKTEQLNEILRNAPPPINTELPDVWDPCHSQQMLRQMVSIINNRNADCPVTEKAVRKNKATVVRIYMDRPTAENKIDHSVPSRQLYDRVLSLVNKEALSAIENTYTDHYWDWLCRYFLCRAIFNQEEREIRTEIDDFKDRMQAMATQGAVLSNTRKQVSILSNAHTAASISAFDAQPSADHLMQVKALEYQNRLLFEKQEEFNDRFGSFAREIGEFSVIPSEYIAEHYGQAIAEIWEGFEIEEPYSMCMAFLSLLDQGSDLPWCYFPSVMLQSCYVSMLPWTRTRFIPSCDDIWEHYDPEVGDVVPGPSNLPLSKKIKVPDFDNWYRMQYHDAAKARADSKDLLSLSHIMYEVTGCLMPRNSKRHLAGLNTLNRYGINNKKTNQNLLYCMSLLSEAKHQSLVNHTSGLQDTEIRQMPDTVEALQEEVLALREELSQCRQSLQDATNNSGAGTNRINTMQKQLALRDYLIHDLSTIVFDSKIPNASSGAGFPYHTASYLAVFSSDESWIRSMDVKLPDVVFFREMPKNSSEILRSVDTIWIQPKDMSHDLFRKIIAEARKSDVPVRVFPFSDVNSCAALLVQADISR